MKGYISISEYARAHGLSDAQVRWMIKTGKLAAEKIGVSPSQYQRGIPAEELGKERVDA